MQRIFVPIAALALLAGLMPGAPALAQSPQNQGDQGRARAEMRAGRNMPIGEIERRIIPRLGRADYLGFEYDSSAGAYRLKFIEGGQVIWVDVDAKTANVLRISR